MNYTLNLGLIGLAVLGSSFSASAQETCNAKDLTFSEYAQCMDNVLVNDTQSMCLNAAKCVGAGVTNAFDVADEEVAAVSSSDVLSEVEVDVVNQSEVVAQSKPVVGVVADLGEVAVEVSEDPRVAKVAYEVPPIVVEPQVKSMSSDDYGYEARVLFGFGSADLKQESKAELDEIATVLLAKPHLTLTVEGHASADGDDSYNFALSSERARSVRGALIARGVPANRIAHKGFGETRLQNVAQPNSSENRRVEMVLGRIQN